jgi:hypothetical protein
VAAIVFVLLLNAYPFVDVQWPGLFAIKIVGTVTLVNAVGYGFYRMRLASREPRPRAVEDPAT